MAWTELVNKKYHLIHLKWSETEVSTNGNTDKVDLSHYRGGEVQINVAYGGASYTDEQITFKVQKSADGTNWEDTGIELTHTNGSALISASFDIHNIWYRVEWTETGTNKDYDFDIHLIVKG